jgi:ankyrin repeat protein
MYFDRIVDHGYPAVNHKVIAWKRHRTLELIWLRSFDKEISVQRMKWVPKTEQKDQKKNDQVRPPESPVRSQPKPRHKHQKRAKKIPTTEDLLYAAVMADQSDEIKSLIRLGGDPNMRHGIMGDTLLHLAAMKNKKQATLALIEMKAQVNLIPTVSRGMPLALSRGAPLHIAAAHGHIEIIEILCRAEAKVNLQDKLGDTPLHAAIYAAYHPSLKATIAALLKLGADPTIKNGKELTPAAVALAWDEPDIVGLLIKWQFPKYEDQVNALKQTRQCLTSAAKLDC